MNLVESAEQRESRIDGLDQLHAKLTTTKRRRSPVEAPRECTDAYVALQFAYGYARLGCADRARILIVQARAALANVASDAVHAWLLEAFEARIAQAIAGSPAETPLPDPINVRLAELSRVSRYKVERLREVSTILNSTESIDPTSRFGHRRDWREFETLYALEFAARARELGQLFELAHTTPNGDERTRLLIGILDALFGLPEAEAIPLLARASASVATETRDQRAMLYTRALRVAGYFGRTELFSDLLIGIRVAIADAPLDLAWVTHNTARVLQRYGMRRELGELVEGLERAETESERERTEQARLAEQATRAGTLALVGEIGKRRDIDDLFAHVERTSPDHKPIENARVPLTARVACAGALALMGETARAALIFDTADEQFQAPMTMPARLELTRALALAYSNMPVDDRVRRIDQLANAFAGITDSFGTNSHFGISALQFVESLVIGISSDEDRPAPTPPSAPAPAAV